MVFTLEQFFHYLPLPPPLKTSKISGYDGISAYVFKKVPNEIFVMLKNICNISLAKGVFPDKLTIAQVTQIFRKGNDTLVRNHRPISVLLCFSKLIKHIMAKKIYSRKFYWGILIFKAFDTVNHNILLEKIKGYGVQSENLG